MHQYACLRMQGLSSSPSDGLRRGIRPGEGAMREVAAYLLDHEHFAGVPPTALVSCHDSGPLPSEYSKIGSLQVCALCCTPSHPGDQCSA